MNIYALDISWAATTNERRHVHWELLGCEHVHGVFATARDGVLAVLYRGNRRRFDRWARTIEPDVRARATTTEQGAM
jgi:hypothetical protein